MFWFIVVFYLFFVLFLCNIYAGVISLFCNDDLYMYPINVLIKNVMYRMLNVECLMVFVTKYPSHQRGQEGW